MPPFVQPLNETSVEAAQGPKNILLTALSVAPAIKLPSAGFYTPNLPRVGTVLTKSERIAIYSKELLAAPAARNADEALKLLETTMNKVEDAYSGIKPVRDPGLTYEGRMYAPRADHIKPFKEDGSIRAVTQGNVVIISPNGTITTYFRDRNKPYGIGTLMHTKPGAKP